MLSLSGENYAEMLNIKTSQYQLRRRYTFGWGASKSTTQGGTFDLLLYITLTVQALLLFENIIGMPMFRHVEQYQYCCSHFNYFNPFGGKPSKAWEPLLWPVDH